MAARANAVAKSNMLHGKSMSVEQSTTPEAGLTYSARINCNTIVLIVNIGTGYDNVRAAADVESVSVVTTLAIASLVVDGHSRNGEPITAVDTNSLNRSVLNLESGDCGCGKIMGVEKLGLGLATIPAFAVPPASSLWI